MRTMWLYVMIAVLVTACQSRDEQAENRAQAHTSDKARTAQVASLHSTPTTFPVVASYPLHEVSNALARFETLLQEHEPDENVTAASNLALFAAFDPGSIEYQGYVELINKYLRFFNEVPLNKDTYPKLIACYSNAALKAQSPAMALHIYYWIGQKAWEMRDVDTALAYLESRSTATDDDAEARAEYHKNLTLLAHIYAALEDEDALLRLGTQLATSPSYAARYKYYEELTMLYCALGDRNRAIQAAEAAVHAIPKNKPFGVEARQLCTQLTAYMAPRPRTAHPKWERRMARVQFLLNMGRADEARQMLARALTEAQPASTP